MEGDRSASVGYIELDTVDRSLVNHDASCMRGDVEDGAPSGPGCLPDGYLPYYLPDDCPLMNSVLQ